MLRRIAQRQEELRLDWDRLLRRRIFQGGRPVEIQVAHFPYDPRPIAFMRQNVMIEPARVPACTSESFSLTWERAARATRVPGEGAISTFRTAQASFKEEIFNGEKYGTNGSRVGRSRSNSRAAAQILRLRMARRYRRNRQHLCRKRHLHSHRPEESGTQQHRTRQSAQIVQGRPRRGFATAVYPQPRDRVEGQRARDRP